MAKPLPWPQADRTSVFAQYTLRVPDRDALQARLQAAGIPTAVHYPIPLNQQYAVADSDAKLPVGDTVAQKVVSLPMHPYLDEASILRIVQTINCA